MLISVSILNAPLCMQIRRIRWDAMTNLCGSEAGKSRGALAFFDSDFGRPKTSDRDRMSLFCFTCGELWKKNFCPARVGLETYRKIQTFRPTVRFLPEEFPRPPNCPVKQAERQWWIESGASCFERRALRNTFFQALASRDDIFLFCPKDGWKLWKERPSAEKNLKWQDDKFLGFSQESKLFLSKQFGKRFIQNNTKVPSHWFFLKNK